MLYRYIQVPVNVGKVDIPLYTVASVLLLVVPTP